jgi:hypothetical protein
MKKIITTQNNKLQMKNSQKFVSEFAGSTKKPYKIMIGTPNQPNETNTIHKQSIFSIYKVTKNYRNTTPREIRLPLILKLP